MLKYILIFMSYLMLVGCEGGDEKFLNKYVDFGNRTIESVELLVAGQSDSLRLTPDVNVPIVVQVKYSDGSAIWAPTSDTEFSMQWQSGLSLEQSIDHLVIENSLLHATHAHVDDVLLTATYEGHTSQPVLIQVDDKTLSGLQLTPSELHMVKGAQSLLRLDAFYDDGSSVLIAPSDALTIHNSVPEIVSFDVETGMIQAIRSGISLISVELDGIKSNEIEVSVVNESVSSILITSEALTIAKGASSALTATGFLSDGSHINLTSSVHWHHDAAISINELGGVKGNETHANATVFAEFDGVQSNTVSFEVKDADIQALKLTPQKKEISLAEAPQTLSLIAQYTDGTSLPYQGVNGTQYTLDEAGIVNVDEQGYLYPISEGTVLLTAKAQDSEGEWVVSNSVVLTVTAIPLETITLHTDEHSLPVGVWGHIQAIGEFLDGRTEDMSSQVSWQSSDTSVVTVADGIVYGSNPGKAKLTAYLNGVLSTELELEITDAQLSSLQGYFSSPQPSIEGEVSLPIGAFAKLEAIASFSDGSVHVVTEQVTWQSSDHLTLAPHQNGVYLGEAPGTASVFARVTMDGIQKETVHFNVEVTDAVPVSLDIVPSVLTLKENLSSELYAIAIYSDGTRFDVSDSTELFWSVDNDNVSIVSTNQTTDGVTLSADNVGESSVKALWSGLEAVASVVVEESTLSAITLTPASLTLDNHTGTQLRVMGVYDNGEQQDITSSVSNYRSNDASIATVNEAGFVTAKASGVATITATFDGFVSHSHILVPNVQMIGLRIETETQIIAGLTAQASAIASYDDGSEVDVSSAADWQSSESNVVINSGLLWALDATHQQATVTATFHGFTASRGVEITQPTLQLISITPSELYIIEGESKSFLLEAIYSDGSVVDATEHAIWRSGDHQIVGFVPDTSTMMASKTGTTMITGQLGSLSTSANVYVASKSQSVLSLKMTPNSLTLPEGESAHISVEAEYESQPGVYYDVTDKVIWSVNTEYAFISHGEVFALLESNEPIVITATYGEQKATMSVNITSADVAKIQITPEVITLAKGHSQPLTAHVVMSNGVVSPLDINDIEWTVESGEGVMVDPENAVVIATEANKSAVIRGDYGDLSETIDVSTTGAVLDSVWLTDLSGDPLPYSTMLAKGMSLHSKVVGVLTDGFLVELDQSDVTYSIDGDSASENSGELLAVNEGVSEVTAHYQKGGESFVSQPLILAVSAASVESLTIQALTSPFIVHTNRRLTVHARMTDGTILDITNNADWASESVTNAVFLDNSNLSALSSGSVTVTASFGGQNTSLDIDIIDAAITHISVEPQVSVVTLGHTEQFISTAHFDNGTSQVLSDEVSWSVNGDSATIDTTGLLTASKEGLSVVTATLNSAPEQQASADIGVVERTISHITTTLNDSVIAKGLSTNIKAFVTYEDGTSEDITALSAWLSSDPDVAMITKGHIRGLSEGSTTLHASYRGVDSQEEVITVSNATLSSLQLTPALVSLPKGYDQTLTLTGVFSDGTSTIIDNSLATWSVSGGGVTVVDGIVTGVTEGSVATVTADYLEVKATAHIQVSSAILEYLVLKKLGSSEPLSVELTYLGIEEALQVSAVYSDGTILESFNDTKLSYKTSDAGVISIVSSDSTSYSYRAESVGLATMWVEYTDPITRQVINSNIATITVTAAGVQALNIEPSYDPSDTLIAGNTYILEAYATLTDGSRLDVSSLAEWGSDDLNIVENSEFVKGGFYALSSGLVTVTANYQGQMSSYDLLISDTELASLSITPDLPLMIVGDRLQFNAQGIYTNSQSSDVTDKASWYSDDTSIVTIDSTTGEATAIGVGVTAINATKHGITESTHVYVQHDKVVDSVEAEVMGLSTLPLGTSTLLNAKIAYFDGEPDDSAGDKVQWLVDKPTTGYVYGSTFYSLSEGSATLQAVYGGVVSNDIVITVSDAVIKGIELTPSTKIELSDGRTYQANVVAIYSDNTQSANLTDADWSSSDDTIASVNNGLITAHSVGIADITVTYGDYTQTVEVEVNDADIVNLILNNNETIILDKGRTQTVVAHWLYSDGHTELIDLSHDDFTLNVGDRAVANFDISNKNELTTLSEGMTYINLIYTDPSDGTVYTSANVSVLVQSKKITSLTFTQSEAQLAKGTQAVFMVEATFTNGNTLDVTSAAIWSSSEESIATVNRGVVSAINSADLTNNVSTLITAQYDDIEVSTSVTVTDATLTHVTMSPSAIAIHQGTMEALSLTAHFSDGTSFDQSTLANWQSSAPSVASVDAANVEGVSSGQSTVSATLNGHTATAEVFVLEKELLRIEVVFASDSIVVGEASPISVNAYYTDAPSVAVEVTSKTAWDTVHTYVLDSKLYGHSVGTDNITAKFYGQTASLTVQVLNDTPTNMYTGLRVPSTLYVESGFYLEAYSINSHFETRTINLSNLANYVIDYDEDCLLLSTNAYSSEHQSYAYFKAIAPCTATKISLQDTSGTYPDSDDYFIDIGFSSELTITAEGARDDGEGNDFGAIGDVMPLVGSIGGLVIDGNDMSYSLLIGHGFVDLIKDVDTGITSAHFISANGDLPIIEDEGKFGRVVIEGRYTDATGREFYDYYAINNLGKLVESVQLHQYFPEPVFNASTNEELVNTTRVELLTGKGRALFVTIEYSDGSTETDRLKHLLTYEDYFGNTYEHKHEGISRLVAFKMVHATQDFAKRGMISSEAETHTPITESDAESVVYDWTGRGVTLIPTTCNYPTNFGSGVVPHGRYLAAYFNGATTDACSSGTVAGTAVEPGVISIVAVVNQHQGYQKASAGAQVVVSNVFELTVVESDDYKHATWGISSRNYNDRASASDSDPRNNIVHPAVLVTEGAEIGYWMPYTSIGFIRTSWQHSYGVEGGLCNNLYPSTNVGNFGLANHTGVFYGLDENFVRSNDLKGAYLGWHNTSNIWSHNWAGSLGYRVNATSTGMYATSVDATNASNRLNIMCQGCMNSGSGVTIGTGMHFRCD